ncbi:MAG: hypothetical protein J3Q66DRAFT_344078 [Benniella sp.]|nr:MAG: hypothetical protein J3Q66DRAFT_344078 [Benniella sp.]
MMNYNSIRGKDVLHLFTRWIVNRGPQGVVTKTHWPRIHTSLLRLDDSSARQYTTTPDNSDKHLDSGSATVLKREVDSRHSFPWTLEEDQLLYQYTQQGLTDTDVYQHFPGRTLNAITVRMSRIRNAKQIPLDSDGSIAKPLASVHREKDIGRGRLETRMMKELFEARHILQDEDTSAKLKALQAKKEQEDIEKFKRKASLGKVPKRRAWSQEEKALLRRLVVKYQDEDGIWGFVAGGSLEDENGKLVTLERTDHSCRIQWAIMNQENRRWGVWSKEEHDKLLAAIREQVGEGYQLMVDVLRDSSSSATTEAPEDIEGKEAPRPLLRLGGPELSNLDWMKIAKRVETRNHVQCRTHFYLSRHNGNRGRWTLEEVKRLMEAHAEYGNQWRAIAVHVGTRSPEQVRDAYKTFLE